LREEQTLSKHHRKTGGRTTPKGTRPSGQRAHHRQVEPSLANSARTCLRDPSPLELMLMASAIIELTTPRTTDSWAGRPERTDGPSTFMKFATSGDPATESLALAVAAQHPDRQLAENLTIIARNGRRPTHGPAWLSTMADITVTDTVEQTEVMGDGINLMVSWRWSDGNEATAVIYVDHNMGTIVKDAFVVPIGMETLAAQYDQLDETGLTRAPVSPADLRARVEQATADGERVVPPLETESWPSCRPIVEWVLRHLPGGGTGFARVEWPEADRQLLLDEFVASPFGHVAGLERTTVRDLTDQLVWFGCDYGPGDPLRWSPVSVEIVLSDWYPRKVFGFPEAELRRLPDVLAQFVRFSHDRKGWPGDLTDETLAAVERWRPAFVSAISSPRRSPFGNVTRMARIAAGLNPDDFDDDDEELFESDLFDDADPFAGLSDEEVIRQAADIAEENLIELAGGRAAYEAMDDKPLPDLPFDWSQVPDDLREQTSEALAVIDRWATELYDPEVGTIARHVLAAVVAGDPRYVRQTARPPELGAAILYYVARRLSERTVKRSEMPWKVHTQKQLAEATGVPASTISKRQSTVARIVGSVDLDWSSLLHSTERRDFIATRQMVAEWRADYPGR
jgi:hypothetical protein